MEACFADKDFSSWTGLGRSGHVQLTTFRTNLQYFVKLAFCLLDLQLFAIVLSESRPEKFKFLLLLVVSLTADNKNA